MAKRVLLALASPALLRVAEHLLRDLPAVDIVDRSTSAEALRRDAARLAPDLIVMSTQLLGREVEQGAAALKDASPGTKLVIITSDDEWRPAGDHRRGADAALDEEDLV